MRAVAARSSCRCAACSFCWRAGPRRRLQPVSLFGGRLRLAGEASGTIAPGRRGLLQLQRLRDEQPAPRSASTSRRRRGSRASRRCSRTCAATTSGAPASTPCYLRVSPWPGRPLDLQAGLVPPVFGAFARRRYASENPLPSVPLAYQYLTDLRYDAIPATAEQLLAAARRAAGWFRIPWARARRSPACRSSTASAGTPASSCGSGASRCRWPSRSRKARRAVRLIEDDNGGKQVAGRLAWTPGPSLTVGVSAASGDFLARSVTATLPEAGPAAATARTRSAPTRVVARVLGRARRRRC